MNEVIFQGAENTNPLNMAEVSLTFDNKDQSLDIDFDKVVITRRIYRDGENEYKINNKKVRLKDIRELFLDTGIGKEGYSLIGQGRIDEIISSSNLERRAIFEEASGISKHKYRRDEASKKLDKVTEDLDIIEYEWEYKKKDLAKLKIEAENHNKWTSQSDLLNQKSYHYMRNKSKSLLESKKSVEADIEANHKLIADINKSIDIIKSKLGPFNETYENLNNEILAKESKLRSLEKVNENNKNKIDLNTQKLSYSNKDLARIEDNLSSNNEKSSSLTTKLEAENQNLSDKKLLIADLNEKIKDFELEINELSKDSDKIIAELETITSHKAAIDKSIYDYEVSKRSMEIIDQKLAEEIKVNQKRLAEIQAEIEDLNIKLKDLSAKKIDLYNQSESISKDINTRKEDLDKINNDLTYLNSKLNQNNIDLKTQINEYKFSKNLLENNEGYFYSVSDFLNKTKAQGLDKLYIDTLANLISVKEGYEEIIDNLMGASLQNIITRTKDDSRDLIKFVNANHLGRITFLPIDSVSGRRKGQPDYPEVIAMAYDLIAYDEKLTGIINQFLGSTVVVKNIDDATSLSKNVQGYKIITLDLDVISSWGSMAAGSNKNKKTNTGLLNRKKNLKQSEIKINKLRVEKAEIDTSIEKVIEKKHKLEDELQSLSERFEVLNTEKTDLNNQITNIDYKLENLNNRKEELASNIETDNSNIEAIDIDDLYAKRDKYGKLVEDYTNKQKDYENKVEDLKASKIKNQNDLELAQRDINMITNTIGQITDELNNLAYSLKLEDKLKAESTDIITEAAAENEKLNKEIARNKELIAKLEESLENLRSELSDKESQNKTQLEKLKTLEDELNNRELQKVKYEYKLESYTKDYDNLIDDIKPFISIGIDQLEEKFKDQDKIDVTKAELINLQKSINSIGYFTEDSLENYKAAREDFIFIDRQLADLRESQANILKMIEALESEMKEEFKKNFDIINEKFARIFTTLFMGGEARLKLDNEDELIAGVDIIARPPSKSLKSISLLSGGEKALTAVALLFAIFETNPAPFAILDEIDAALDETNIKRYIEYLKTLSVNSQFIMITHRQTTMQLAEMIYGVTIGDDGISKIYSIDFDDN